MATFKFRLKALKRYRKDRVVRAQKEFSDLSKNFRDLTLRLENSYANRLSLLDDISKCQEDIGKVKLFSDLISSETIRIKRLDEEIVKQKEDLERYRSWVEHLHRELRIVENLEDKQRTVFEEEKKKKERKEVEGWVVERWGRRKNQ